MTTALTPSERPATTRPGKAVAAQEVVFIENALPPLRDGSYLLSATQAIPGQDPGTFGATATFVVNGERFTIAPDEIDSVFPPNLANGEFDGVFAHVVCNRRTLPWERSIDTPNSGQHYPKAPWLAVFVLDAAAAPQPKQVTVADLVPLGTHITVVDSPVTGTGTLPASTLSYGADLLHELGYGEAPDNPCTVIDLPVAVFSQLAPAAADLPYLAHIREVDTTTGVDAATTSEQHAVVIANRVPAPEGVAHAFLVSLEGMADYLPAADGTPSGAIGPGIDTVRLLTYRSWTFTVNDLDETLEKLLEGLNQAADGTTKLTTLMLPIAGDPPSPTQIATAMAHQAAGAVSADDARVLVQNALLLGYVPADHHLRHGGSTVSCYRGPFVPRAVTAAVSASQPLYYSSPDAATAYNPQTGMFDVSYGAAWRLGQLLALQSGSVSSQLYEWKRQVTQADAMAAEQQLLAQRLMGADIFPTVLGRRASAIGNGPPPLPADVVTWFGNLAALRGLPFNYLVPDERMLPPESLRFFYVDQGWIDALIDGAFSIGRAGVSAHSIEAKHAPVMRRLARAAASRRIDSGQLPAETDTQIVTGFLLRSQAVAGWPNLRINGFRDPQVTDPIDTVRSDRLSADTVLCLFNEVVAAVTVREPPEQLHHGVSGPDGGYYTILRSVSGGPGPIPPGQQYTASPVVFKSPCDPEGTHPWTCVSLRGDGRTVRAATTATAIQNRLATDFGQVFRDGFTAAEYALELTKGTVEVEFTR